MHRKESELIVRRIERFYSRVGKMIVGESVRFDASYFTSLEHVPYKSRRNFNMKPIEEGKVWGKFWESGWFHLKSTIPTNWKGKKVIAQLDFGGEGLVYDADGDIVQGISNGSVFDHDFNRDIIHLSDDYNSGDEIELWVETAANGLFGMFTEPDPTIDSPNRYGHYEAKVNKIRLALFDIDMWHLWLDLRILLGLIKRLDEKSVRRSRIIHVTNDAINQYADDITNINKCRAILKELLTSPANASALQVAAVGHAHIDTAWLWPIDESVRKCARTFASQLKLIEQYPDYVFGASQPQHYQFIKDRYPELYKKIKQAVKKGQWELQGAMWVEADCNLISGESMIRQVLYGKQFFKDEFDIEVRNLWLPDVFGYSAALPQILQKSGIDYFLTQKISWNQFNDFPHHTFMWRGIDGSEVLTHFPPENTYNSQLDTEYLIPAESNFKEKGYINSFISLFGVGDGGGGPKEENIELGRRLQDLEGAPKVTFGKADEFFKQLANYRNQLPHWVGELYLELHRGTLTTQAFIKKANRKTEYRLKAIEMLSSILPVDKYPQDQLTQVWKNLLLHQFHDIIPGSSITKVYEDARTAFADMNRTLDVIENQIINDLFDKDENSVTVLNSLSYPYEGLIELSYEDKPCCLQTSDGTTLPYFIEKDRVIISVKLEPISLTTFVKVPIDKRPADSHNNDLCLENDVIRYEFNNQGLLVSIYDKEVDREILLDHSPGNCLTLYDDHPNDWDAWDIDLFYENAVVGVAEVTNSPIVEMTDIGPSLKFTYKIGQSVIKQDIKLSQHNKRLDFNTAVDWQEKHRMLRVSFPVDVNSDEATFDIQYGYVKRPTHRNTSWDLAKFEVTGHRYADLSDNAYGVALLNDCKYGYKVLDNVMDLNLLRSPNYPDPDADIGRHTFIYSLYPHRGTIIDSDVIEQAAALNVRPVVFDGVKALDIILPWQIDADSISIEAVKKAEKEPALILRLVETKGIACEGQLRFENNCTVWEVDMIEWHEYSKLGHGLTCPIKMKPFEIKTIKIM